MTDFGLCKIGLEENETTNSFCGSPEYMAPEVVKRDGHSYAVDYYTLGALLHELVCGLPPYYTRDPDQMMENILKDELKLPADLPDDLQDLLYKLLDKNKVERIHSFKELKKHPWLRNVDWEAYQSKKVPSPLTIDIYNSSNIHQEFLEIPVNPDDFHEDESFRGQLSFFNYVQPELEAGLLNKDPSTGQSAKQIIQKKIQEQKNAISNKLTL